MENSICISKTLLSKQRDREQYWGAYRWHGRAKAAFYFGLINAIGNSIFLSVFTAILFLDPYAKNEIGYILLCIFCWLFMVFFALLMIFQDRIFANKSEKLRIKQKGLTPLYAIIEFYDDHFIATSQLFDDTYRISYSDIIEFKETENYCILFTLTVGVAHESITFLDQPLLNLAESIELTVADHRVPIQSKRLHPCRGQTHDSKPVKAQKSVPGIQDPAVIRSS